jgi:hypothetical protein
MEGELLEFHDFLLSGAPNEKSPGDFPGPTNGVVIFREQRLCGG